MPLRLTISEVTLSGHQYDDVLGRSYEYPVRYRTLVQEGERFVYYRGRRTASSHVQPQAYLGTGIIGPVHASRRDSQRLVCEIEDWCPFLTPLYFRDAAGHYYESVGKQGGFYWQVGVRKLSEGVYERILRDAENAEAEPTVSAFSDVGELRSGYPSQAIRDAVDEYAMAVALKEAEATCPTRLSHGSRITIGDSTSGWGLLVVSFATSK